MSPNRTGSLEIKSGFRNFYVLRTTATFFKVSRAHTLESFTRQYVTNVLARLAKPIDAGSK